MNGESGLPFCFLSSLLITMRTSGWAGQLFSARQMCDLKINLTLAQPHGVAQGGPAEPPAEGGKGPGCSLRVLFGFRAALRATWRRPAGRALRLRRCALASPARMTAPPLPSPTGNSSKGCFSDHFALIKCSCHNSGCWDACKTFLPHQNKAETP